MYAVKAIQKRKVKDYATFVNEINILKMLVSLVPESLTCFRITQTLSNSLKFGSGMTCAS
jgi:hypothetical protein